MAEQRELPGWPKKRLVRAVRRHMWSYGIRPQWALWCATWRWAAAIANSYFHTSWPSASEISTQYLVLLVAQMRENHALRLPYRADKVIPDEVRVLLPSSPLQLLTDEKRIEKKRIPVNGASDSSPT